MNAFPVFFLSMLAAIAPLSALADLISETVVAITCETPGKLPRKGSGVVIAANGTILTAKHVVFGESESFPDHTVCRGSTGKANFAPDTFTFKKASVQYDAVLLKSPMENVPFQRYCKLAPWMLREQVIATGFPLDSRTGVPSSRVGVLSTVEPDAEGIIETDSSTTSGLSGGMYTLASSGHLLGIVSGFDQDNVAGIVANYRMLVAEVLADEFANFGLIEDTEGCTKREWSANWQTGDGPKSLGMQEGDGVCFLTRVYGNFNDPEDSVGVEKDNGAYVLNGVNRSGGNHGATAQCITYH